MENKNFQILEIDTFQLPLVKFISKTVKDRGNPLTYYRKLSTQSTQQKSYYTFQICWPLLEIKQQNILKEHFARNCIKLYKNQDLFSFGNKHFSVSFGQVFHRNGKCKRKFANIPPTAVSTLHSKIIIFGLICILKNKWSKLQISWKILKYIYSSA